MVHYHGGEFADILRREKNGEKRVFRTVVIMDNAVIHSIHTTLEKAKSDMKDFEKFGKPFITVGTL